MTRRITVARYPLDAWRKCFPESTREEWEQSQFPNDTLNFFISAICDASEEQGVPVEEYSCKVVTIDGEYFDWLDAMSLEDTHATRCRYSYTVSDSKAKELLVRNEMDRSVRLMYFPVGAFVEDPVSGSYRIPREKISLIAESVREETCADETLVADVFVDAECMSEHPNELAEAMLRGDDLSAWAVEQFGDESENLQFLCIPVLIVKKVESPVFCMRDDEFYRFSVTDDYPLSAVDTNEFSYSAEICGTEIAFFSLSGIHSYYHAEKQEESFFDEMERTLTDRFERVARTFRITKIFQTSDDPDSIVLANLINCSAFEDEEEDEDS